MYRKKIHSAIWRQKMRRNESTRGVLREVSKWCESYRRKPSFPLRMAKSVGTLDANDGHDGFALSVRLVPLSQQTDLLCLCPPIRRRVPLIWQTEFVADIRVLLQAGTGIQHKSTERPAQPKPPVNKMVLKKTSFSSRELDLNSVFR